jgi:hypothetical protein
MKWVGLVKRSTLTHIELYPYEVWGKPTMKSMQIFSHFHSVMHPTPKQGWLSHENGRSCLVLLPLQECE